jgi:hypothetical protein
MKTNHGYKNGSGEFFLQQHLDHYGEMPGGSDDELDDVF